MAKVYDIAVLGATAAGYVAAASLARQKHTVVVVDAPAGRTESPLADWIPSDLPRDCELFRKAKSALGVPFKSMVFHSADLTRQAEYTSRGTLGYILQSEKLLEGLDGLARKAGVEKIKLEQPPKLEMRETSVRLHGQRELSSQLLLIAQDNPAEVVANLALPVRTVPPERMTICGLDAPLVRGRRAKAMPALHVVAFHGTDMMGMFFAVDGLMHVRIVSSAFAPPATIDSLVKLISGLKTNDLLEGRLELNKAKAAIWHPPGGMALELEMHTAKRTMLVGTAGGFASATTGQTLDPSVRSALVAADVAENALHSRKVQETIWQYKNQWRETLADRIRPPGTSLQMLLPMVLTNKAILGKFARAFLYGQSL